MSNGRWNIKPGLNHVGAYQVSGQPFCTGGINAREHRNDLPAGHPGGAVCVEFPYVTRWFRVINKDDGADLKVGFSAIGVTSGGHEGESFYFKVPRADVADGHGFGDSGVLELKVSEIYISGALEVDVIAGLTKIDRSSVSTASGSNWSGSIGVG